MNSADRALTPTAAALQGGDISLPAPETTPRRSIFPSLTEIVRRSEILLPFATRHPRFEHLRLKTKTREAFVL